MYQLDSFLPVLTGKYSSKKDLHKYANPPTSKPQSDLQGDNSFWSLFDTSFLQAPNRKRLKNEDSRE